MAFLIPDKIVEISIAGKKLQVKQKIISDNLRATKYVCSYIPVGAKIKPCALLNNGTGKPLGITIHNTAAINCATGTTMAEQYVRATYNGNMGGSVVTFYVRDYDDIWQELNENERGWHTADGISRRTAQEGACCTKIGGNVDTISIECIGNSVEAEDATALLTAHLLKKYSLTINDVYSHHYFYAKKYCPVYILPHWGAFIKTIEKYRSYNENLLPAPAKPELQPTKEIYRIRLTWVDIKSQKGAYYNLDSAIKTCPEGYTVFNSKGMAVYANPAFEEGDIVKLAKGATYYNGNKIPLWLFLKKLYVRQIVKDKVVVSTVKTGAITGVVSVNNIIRA